MYGRCVEACQRCGHLDEYAAFGTHRGRDADFGFHILHRHHRIVRLALLAGFLLVLLPLFDFFLQFFHPLFVTFLGQCGYGVGAACEQSGGVCHHVVHLHQQRVSVDQSRVAQPVEDGVALLRRFDDKCVRCVEVDAFDSGQAVAAVSEVEVYASRVLPLGLEQVAVGLRHGECQQHDVVRTEMRVGHTGDGVDTQFVAPDGVLPYVRAAARHEGVVAEGHHFALLAVDIVSVGILKGIYAVCSRCDALYDEASPAVRARYAYHRFCGECRVGQVVVQSYEYSFYRLEVACVEYVACHFKRVNLSTCRETVCVVAHRIVLVVVGDGVGEVDGVCDVVFERVFQFYDNPLSRALYLWRFELRRRHDHLVGRILKFDELVECDGYLACLHSGGLVGR